MKEKRSISGIYFRYQNPENGRWENWTFEDLPDDKQDEILSQKSQEFVKNLCKSLANTINQIAQQFNITTENQ